MPVNLILKGIGSLDAEGLDEMDVQWSATKWLLPRVQKRKLQHSQTDYHPQPPPIKKRKPVKKAKLL